MPLESLDTDARQDVTDSERLLAVLDEVAQKLDDLQTQIDTITGR